MGDQAAVTDEFHQEVRDRLAGEHFARRAIGENSSLTVNYYVVAGTDSLCLRAHQRRQAEVDRVPVEEAGERLGYQRGDAEVLQRLGRLLARRAGAEVAPGDDDVALAHARRE